MNATIRTLAVLAAAALTLGACQRSSDEAFGQRVRAYLLENPQVIEEAVMKLQENQRAQAAQDASQAIETHRAALERDPRDFVANPDGAITVVEFYDYRCGFCKMATPEIMQIIEENPDVRYVFKEFPIFGGESDLAAQTILSPAAKPKALEIHQAYMAEKALDEQAIDRILREAGVDPAAAKAGGRSEAVQQHIADVRQLATELGIEGTPAFVVGDTLVPGADMAALRAAIAEARAGQG